MTTAIIQVNDFDYIIAAEGSAAFATGILQAQLAASRAEAAAADAEDAEAGAELAAAAVGVFPTIAEGEAATVDGQSFYVASGGEVTLYINNAGTGDEVASIVTTAKLASTAPGEGAALVAFKLPGSSTVSREVAEKLSDFRAVEDWGAVGDGVTDDSAAIQQAMDETTGSLWFRSGATYLAEGLVPHNNLTLCGAATIRPPLVQTDHVIHYNSEDTLYDFNIEELTFIGRGVTTYDAIHITHPAPSAFSQNWNEATLYRLDIRNFRKGVFCPTPRSVRIRDCDINTCDIGIEWHWEHFYLDHSTIFFNRIGLHIGQGTPMGTGIHHFRLFGNAIAHNTEAGMRGNMSSGEIIGGSFIDNGSDPATGSGHGHIVIEAGARNMRVLGVRFEKGPATPYAIRCDNPGITTTRWNVMGCHFLTMGVADIYGSFNQSSFVDNLSRVSGGSFFKNTGNSTADLSFVGNQISECSRHAYDLSGTLIGIKIQDVITNAGLAVVTADVATDELLLSHHGLLTGQPLQFATTGTLPSPLATGTTYYAIAVDEDTIKVASSEVDANAGTAINITSAGTNTQLVVSTYSGIKVQPGALISGMNFGDSSFRNISATKYTNYAVELTGVIFSQPIRLKDIFCRNLAGVPTIATTHTAIRDGSVILDSCDGTVSENTFTATIIAGDLFTDHPHGLSYTPSATRFSINPQTPVAFAITNITATHVRIAIASTSPSPTVFNCSVRLRK